jgi:hypothetical protein
MINTQKQFKNDNLGDDILIIEEDLINSGIKGLDETKKKEVVKEVLMEKIKEEIPKQIDNSLKEGVDGEKVSPVFVSKRISVSELKKLPKLKQLDILVGLALKESLAVAIYLARQLNNPYILDEFHDVLIDRFYEELIKRGRI